MNADISILLALGAGVLSFFSPCILPLIPSYLTFLIGDYASSKRHNTRYSIIPALLFIAGFSLVFIILGLSASYLGQFILQKQILIQKISGVLVIVLGLHLTGIIKIKSLYHEKGLNLPQNLNKYLGAFVLGVGLAFAWTPCIGPILSSILIYAGNSQNIMQGGLLLASYSLGLAVPFFLVAISVNRFLPGLKKINPYLPLINKIAGILIIVLGVLIYTDHLKTLIIF